MLIYWSYQLFSIEPINLVVEEISPKKTCCSNSNHLFYKSKGKNVYPTNSILTVMKSDAPLFCIDIIHTIYLDVKNFSVVCLCICYEKLAVKTTLTRVGHFFAKKLNLCPSNIIWNSSALKLVFEIHFKNF